jgi:GR25 family glycosyltransferase involved in LPS biosynthesis
VESLWTPCRLHVDSMRTPPKIHRFYGESMDFGWTMISFGKIYPCRSVIVSTLILAHFFTASTLLKLMQLYLQTNTFCRVIYLQAHILFFLTLAESLKSVIHNEKIIIILTTYNIGRYNIDNNNNNNNK